MQRATAGFISAAAVAIAVVGLAFLVAPRACAGGLDLYVWCGGAALLVLLALPSPRTSAGQRWFGSFGHWVSWSLALAHGWPAFSPLTSASFVAWGISSVKAHGQDDGV